MEGEYLVIGDASRSACHLASCVSEVRTSEGWSVAMQYGGIARCADDGHLLCGVWRRRIDSDTVMMREAPLFYVLVELLFLLFSLLNIPACSPAYSF